MIESLNSRKIYAGELHSRDGVTISRTSRLLLLRNRLEAFMEIVSVVSQRKKGTGSQRTARAINK